MTTIIDHAISIPATHTLVWAQVSNPEYFPRWMLDCRRIAYLTTLHRGRGTRIRCLSAARKEYVMELTAWYEGLGFEYRIVDGSAYDDNRGRLRLQEVAEGTIVQWTFTYELGGVLGGLRNSMGMKRTTDNRIVDSLRNLYRYIKETAGDESVKVVKSLMQDAPNVEQRAKYQPRHPSRYVEKAAPDKPPTSPTRPGTGPLFRPIIEEPLITDEDTRPNRRVRTDERPAVPEAPAAALPPVETPAQPSVTEPEKDNALPTLSSLLTSSSLSEIPVVKPDITAPPERLSRTPDKPAVSSDIYPFDTSRTADYKPPSRPSVLPESKPASEAAPPLATPKRVDKKPAATVPSAPEIKPPAPAVNPPVEPAVTVDKPVTEPVRPQAEAEQVDTSRISVFEIFGLQKPSETQQMRAVQLAREIKEQLTAPTQTRLSPVIDPAAVEPVSAEEEAARQAFSAGMPAEADVDPEERRGLRMRQRQHLLALRRPAKKHP